MIINLQKTPKDKKAGLVIHSKVDEVMRHIMSINDFPIPTYKRFVKYKVVITEGLDPESGRSAVSCNLRGLDDQACSPLIRAAEMFLEVINCH